ncbi:MAG: type III-B CRISPR-associated protein Cas10/Cmr2 [Desulfobacteraceae bacterium]|nr:type III-B CRISPR-associated protein Cas10/Cmr2 [Desulfobacteraceae bacterium]
MTEYLISLAIGPVQGFIAAARRTRDLWFGSEVLSEVSKAAAKVLLQNRAELIFPAPGSPTDLEPNSALNVGNKLMAAIDTVDPGQIIELAKEGARSRWREIATAARNKLDPTEVQGDLWNQQVEDVLELYGAWKPLQADGNDYSAVRDRLERLLGARKTTRDFGPAATAFNSAPGFGKPKSSLDAARETVLTRTLTTRTRRKLGLSKGEQLDCPGLVKRIGGDPEQFPPVTRIALEPWLEKLPDHRLLEVKAAFQCLVGFKLATRVAPQRYHRLPYDGGFLFPARIEAKIKELGENETEAKASLTALKTIRDRLHEDYKPTPYFAVLVADGDNMGAFIDLRDSKRDHLAITGALAEFAGQARAIVENRQGACVYAGGDDVLALLPIHQAVACAQDLSGAFNTVVAPLAVSNQSVPTLSVGLGIGHVLTPFSRLLDLGRRAERLAKEGPEGTLRSQKRNALALIAGVRSGAEISVRGRWDSDMDQRLIQWMVYYRENSLSDKTPYDLRQAVGRIAWAKSRPDYRTIAEQEAGRVLARKRSQAGAHDLPTEVRNKIKTAICHRGIEQIISELLLARWLSEKVKE